MKPKPLVELNHFTVPVVMMNPFVATLNLPESVNSQDEVATDFEREVRQARCQSRGNQSSASKRSMTLS
jgi:hypothetical protein